jgi:hypothetical protein
VSDVGDKKIAGGFAMIERYARLAVCKPFPLALEITVGPKKSVAKRKKEGSPTVASAKTTRRLVSSIHLILKPPFAFSHSEKAS